MVGILMSSFIAFAAQFGPELEGELAPPEPIAATDTGVVGCSDQFLEDGENLPDLPLFYLRTQPDHSWGSRLMIDTIVEGARHMRWLLPDADPITIGDIAWQHGGPLSGHVSHRGGIDADIGIYRTGAGQNPRGFDRLGDDFDAEANWALISALLDSGNVEFILLDQAHIRRLRTYVLTNGLLTAAEAEAIFPTADYYERTGYVRHAPRHDDHLHVRVLCNDGSRAQ